MNYRHAFHAGNFADVFKHIIIARILTHLREKVAPFRVIDTHAGDGLYDLAGEEANRSGEWRDGIGRLVEAALPADATGLMSCGTIRAPRCWRGTCCVPRIVSSRASLSRVRQQRCPATCAGHDGQ